MALSTLGAWDFDFYAKTTSGTANIIVTDKCNVNLRNPLNNIYKCTGGEYNSQGKVTFSVEHTAWGVLGTNLVGKLYDRKFTSSGTNSAYLTNVGDAYASGVIVATTVLRATGIVGNNTVEAYDSH